MRFSSIKNVFARLSEKFKAAAKPSAEEEYVVEFDDERICLRNPDESIEEILWSELMGFDIETNSLGPLGLDLFWVLYGDQERGCVIPQGATGCDGLLEKLQELQGFDNEAFVEAMASTSDGSFEIWKRENEES